MSFNTNRLYALLPAIYRIQDERQDEPLKALLSVISEQANILEENLDRLYNDQFVETCSEWVIPYIGELLGIQGLTKQNPVNLRAQVANTLAYRRRKGTASILEQLTKDITGYSVRVVEYYRLLATTQHLTRPRSSNVATLDIRDNKALENIGTAFESVPHGVDVRAISKGKGRFNIPNIGIHIWRLKSYSRSASPAYRLDNHRFLFNPLGNNTKLFSSAKSETDMTHIAEPMNITMPISRLMLREDLQREKPIYYGEGKSLYIEEFTKDSIIVCDLSDKDASGDDWGTLPQDVKVALDPETGRILFADEMQIAPIVHYRYGFSDSIGGGEYERKDTLDIDDPLEVNNRQELDNALNNGAQVIKLGNSGVIDGDIDITNLGDGQKLVIQAENKCFPVIKGSINIQSVDNASVTLNGLLITGSININGPKSMTVIIEHCTVCPDRGCPKSLQWLHADSNCQLIISHSICGATIDVSESSVEIRHSIIDAGEDDSEALKGGIANILSCITVFGKTDFTGIELAENCIFTGSVTSGKKQQGCIRFSYLPKDSDTPRRYYCQPELAVERASYVLKNAGKRLNDQDEKSICEKSKPQFTSRDYTHPAYGQLHHDCPSEITTGADDESEMGVFHDLFHSQKIQHLRASFDEYLRLGLEAGIIYEN